LRTFSDKEIKDVETAIAVMPHFDIEYQAFVKVLAAPKGYVLSLLLTAHTLWRWCCSRARGAG